MKMKRYLAGAIWLSALIVIAYQVPRTDFTFFITAYSVSFLAFLTLAYSGIRTREGWFWAIAARVALILAIPELSDDIYRFLWDGHMWNAGINPFSALPTEVVGTASGLTEELMAKMNSPTHYTIYPLICQWVFWLSTWLFPVNELGAIVVIRSILILADIGTILLLQKLNRTGYWSKYAVWLYALNPMVILELTGNLHFEGLMIFFIVLALWLFVCTKNYLATLALGGAVIVKLIPLIFLPFLIRRFGWFKTIAYGAIVLTILGVSFLPFLSAGGGGHFWNSVELYFQNFEFNASVYYVFRWVGYQVVGYNVIAIAGKVLSGAVLASILLLAWQNRSQGLSNLPALWAAALLIYLLFATIVHPWYVIPLLALSLLNGYKYGLAWSFTAMLSYAAYSNPEYTENMWLIAAEYAVLLAFLIHDVLRIGSIGGSNNKVV
jgi:hypothetical protein